MFTDSDSAFVFRYTYRTSGSGGGWAGHAEILLVW